MYSYLLLFLVIFDLFIICEVRGEPYPIGFAISESKIVNTVPEKTRDFAFIVPGDIKTYIYKNEINYYQGYQEAYFGVTTCKAGWDCLRHYEILCNGCIPYFLDLDQCPANTMTMFPKDLIIEAMNLPGVSYLHINHDLFDKEKYFEILNKLLDHTRTYLTTKAMARYVLAKINFTGNGKILYLSKSIKPDYLRCLMLIGLKEIFQNRVVDVPKIPHIYTNYPGDIQKLYGRGMSYTKIINDYPVNRKNIPQRIINKEFDLIIYGSIHRGLPYHDLVNQYYDSDKIVYFCGEDFHKCKHTHLNNLFIREHP